ncbi:PREDICTED: phosphate carrier protein, mitochondrial-like [Papilio polytes]|uniref:phosphate carrier protein, mitochondrial-like n=1 Tax=Papilio polytes TaxID=76194 RepID=UPI0006768D17|nr:PREDICTED: phosphate carrier protein, mitochondrial-like [Papilio polytes]
MSDKKEEFSCEMYSNKFFLLCLAGGAVACGSTHTLLTPLDLVKCRLQVDPAKYKSIFRGFYKFALMTGEENAYLYRTYLYLAAAASAEFCADVFLSPFEATKVRIQTTPGYTSKMLVAMPHMMSTEGIGVFYKGLVPLWARQIPYTMMKFSSFEKTIEMLYEHFVPKPRSQCTKEEQLVVTFTAGYIAGVLCAIVSHPADTLVSKLNKEPGASIGGLVAELGFFGIWRGLVARIIMIGTLTGLQWFIYDGFKVFTAMPRPPPPDMPLSLKKKLAGKK